MPLTTSIYRGISASQVGSIDLGKPRFEFSPAAISIDLADGVLDYQASKIWTDRRTIAASGSESLDFAGTLVDALGATLTFTAIKAIYVKADAANTNDVVVGGAVSNGFVGPFSDVTDKIRVKPDGSFSWVAPKTGVTVTAGTGDLLLVANSSGTTGVTYDIIVVGI